MADFTFQDFLSRFDAGGRLDCSCGMVHRVAAREVIVSDTAIGESAEVLRRIYGRAPVIWVLSDENTEAAAGRRFKSAVRDSRIVSRILPGSPKPVPSQELVDELAGDARRASPRLLVGVGSGVISDLVKKVSLDCGVPNWSVATAASVDAYSSATSAIRVGGYHKAVPAAPSQAIICHLPVIANAPRLLVLSGLGDLLAKLIAHLDWNLGRLITGEHYCPLIAAFALEAARKALAAARSSESDAREAAHYLTDAVLVSGFAMQASGGSRPAASAEHTIAHFWESALAVGNGEYDLHGILVGAASRLVFSAYSSFYGALSRDGPRATAAATAERLASFEREPPWAESLEEGLRPFEAGIAEVMRKRVLDRSILTSRIEAFGRAGKEILDLALPLLAELGQAIRVLDGLGFPFSLDELGIAEPLRLLPVRNVRLLRDRYTTFDLAYELGREGELTGGGAS